MGFIDTCGMQYARHFFFGEYEFVFTLVAKEFALPIGACVPSYQHLVGDVELPEATVRIGAL